MHRPIRRPASALCAGAALVLVAVSPAGAISTCQNGACTATAETVMVLVDDTTRRSTPLPGDLRAKLESYARD